MTDKHEYAFVKPASYWQYGGKKAWTLRVADGHGFWVHAATGYWEEAVPLWVASEEKCHAKIASLEAELDHVTPKPAVVSVEG